MIVKTGNPYCRGRLGTIYLLVLTSLNKLLLILKTFTFLQVKATLMRKLTVLSLPLQLVFPGLCFLINFCLDIWCSRASITTGSPIGPLVTPLAGILWTWDPKRMSYRSWNKPWQKGSQARCFKFSVLETGLHLGQDNMQNRRTQHELKCWKTD
jgi:hypothetical protein